MNAGYGHSGFLFRRLGLGLLMQHISLHAAGVYRQQETGC